MIINKILVDWYLRYYDGDVEEVVVGGERVDKD